MRTKRWGVWGRKAFIALRCGHKVGEREREREREVERGWSLLGERFVAFAACGCPVRSARCSEVLNSLPANQQASQPVHTHLWWSTCILKQEETPLGGDGCRLPLKANAYFWVFFYFIYTKYRESQTPNIRGPAAQLTMSRFRPWPSWTHRTS